VAAWWISSLHNSRMKCQKRLLRKIAHVVYLDIHLHLDFESLQLNPRRNRSTLFEPLGPYPIRRHRSRTLQPLPTNSAHRSAVKYPHHFDRLCQVYCSNIPSLYIGRSTLSPSLCLWQPCRSHMATASCCRNLVGIAGPSHLCRHCRQGPAETPV
jgi:hypothetical protein